MLRHRHIRVFVIVFTLLTLGYSGGAQVAATYTNHGSPARAGTNIEMTITVVLGTILAAAAFLSWWITVSLGAGMRG